LKTYEALRRTSGIKVLVAHRPDEFAFVPSSTALVLAGHTHCGQIVVPIVGALATGSDFGTKYLCGVIRDGSKTLVVTAGLGTSFVPLRFGAPPDIWLITVH
jgi:predicted MPP superfamily phosphohydrolase